MDMGFSMKPLNALSSSAPSAPSITRWSQVMVTVIWVAILISPLRTTAPLAGFLALGTVAVGLFAALRTLAA